uniref:DUF4283 domain-containing protein n=1 Tax=Quercus lobata TaxID=97700 RepID=A0A7N2LZG8_QUELO
MDQEVVNGLEKFKLTKKEEEDIDIANISSPEIFEECSLSLFGRLLLNCHQNLRALKNTLKAAWKMGSDLRIVEIWDLPFENMTEEIGKDIGSKIGRVLEVDKRAMQVDQAKFLRMRVEVPIDKPLRRGRYVKNEEGGRYWVDFRASEETGAVRRSLLVVVVAGGADEVSGSTVMMDATPLGMVEGSVTSTHRKMGRQIRWEDSVPEALGKGLERTTRGEQNGARTGVVRNELHGNEGQKEKEA